MKKIILTMVSMAFLLIGHGQSKIASTISWMTKSVIPIKSLNTLFNHALGDSMSFQMNIGVRTIPTSKGVAVFTYVDSSPSRDNLSGRFEFGSVKLPVYYDFGYKSKQSSMIAFGVDGYFGIKTRSFNVYLEAGKKLGSKNRKHPALIGIRIAGGSASWRIGNVPRNGSYYVINGNTHYSNKNMNMRYLDNLIALTPSIIKQFYSFGGSGFYLKVALNMGFRLAPRIKLTGTDTSDEFFSEKIKLSDPSVSIEFRDSETKRSPIRYSGLTVCMGYQF
jgi:hypothetical protein